MSHTPGPWHRNIAPASKYPTIFAGRNTHVAVVKTQRDDAETEANCDLITAAPEMLATLKAVVAVADRDTVEFRQARAAIAKAEGRS